MPERTVSYDVKDLLDAHALEVRNAFSKIDSGLANLAGRMDGMATKGDIGILHARVDGVTSRVEKIETESVEDKAITRYKDKFVKFSGWIVGGTVVPIASVFLYAYLNTPGK